MAERTVTWKALADFSRARKEADKTTASLAALRREQEKLNAESAAASALDPSGMTKYATAADKASSSSDTFASAQQRQVAALRAAESAESSASSATDQHSASLDKVQVSSSKATSAMQSVTDAISKYQQEASSASSSSDKVSDSLRKTGDSSSSASKGLRDVSNQARDAKGRFSAAADAASDLGREVENSGKSARNSSGGFNTFRGSLSKTASEWQKATQAGADMRWEIAKAKLTIAAVIPAIDTLAAGISNLAGGAVGLAGSLAPAVGILATIPGLATAGAGAIGTLVAGFSGIGGALKAYSQQQKTQSKGTGSGGTTSAADNAANKQATLKNTEAETARENAEAIRNAQQAIQKARQDAADSAIDNAKKVKKAEQGVADAEQENAKDIKAAQEDLTSTRQEAAQSVADAQKAVADARKSGASDIAKAEDEVTQAQQKEKTAQDAVTAARKQAKDAIEDLRKSLKGQALDEEGASLSLEDAQQRLRQVINDPGSTDLERRQAKYAVQQAQQNLNDTKDQNADLTKQYQEASKKGVEGSDQVVQAKANESAAAKDTTDAETNLAQTRVDAANTVTAAQQKMVQAQKQATKDISDAQQKLTDTQVSAAKNLASAQSDLADAQEDSVRSARDSAQAIKQAQQGLADAQKEAALRSARLKVQQDQVAESTGDAAKATDVYADAMKDLTPEAQAVVKQLLKMKTQVDTLRKTAQKGMLPGFLDLLIAVDKLFPQINDFIGKTSKSFGKFFSTLAGIVDSKNFVDDFGKVLDSTSRIIDNWIKGGLNILKVLGRIMVAAIPLTEWLVQSVTDWTDSWDAMTSGEAGQKRLTKFFAGTKKTLQLLGGIVGGLGAALYHMGSVAAQAVGYDLLQSLSDTMQKFNDFTKSAKGKNAIAAWAKAAGDSVKELGKLFVALVQAIGTIGKNVDFADFVKQIRTQLLPALVNLFQDLKPGDGLKKVVPLLVKIVDGFDNLVKKMGGSGEILDLLGQLVDVFQLITKYIPAPALKLMLGFMVVSRVAKFAGEISGLSGAFRLLTDKSSALRQSIDLLGSFRKKAKLAKAGAKDLSDAAKTAGKTPVKSAESTKDAINGVASSGVDKNGNLLPADTTPNPEHVPLKPADTTPNPEHVPLKPADQIAEAGAGAAAAKKVGPKVAKEGVEETVKQGPKLLGLLAKMGPALLGFAEVASKAIAVIPVIGWIIAAVVSVLLIVVPLVIKHWKSIKKAFQTGLSAVQSVVKKGLEVLGGFFGPILQGIVNTAKKVWGRITGVFGPPLDAVWKGIKYTVGLIVSLLKLSWDIIVAAAKVSWGLFQLVVLRPIQALWGLISPVLKKMGQDLVDSFNFWKGVLKKVWDGITKIVTIPFKLGYAAIVIAWNLIGAWLQNQVTKTRNALKKIWDYVKKNVVQPYVDAYQSVVKAWNKIANWLSKAFTSAVKALAKLWAPIKSHIVDPVHSALSPVGTWLGKIKSKISTVLQSALDWVEKSMKTVVGFITKPWTDAWTDLQPILGKIGDGVADALGGIKKVLGKLGGWAKTAWTAFANAVSDPVDFVVNKIINPILGVFRKIGSATGVSTLKNLTDVKWNKPKYGGKQGGGALGPSDGAGYIQGTKSPKRDNVLGVSGTGQAVARVEPGEYVAPRWMSPIFPTLEQARRTRNLNGFMSGGEMQRKRKKNADPGYDPRLDKLAGFKVGGIIGAAKAAVQGATGIGLTQPINAPISNGIHDVGAMGANSSAVDASASPGHPVVAGANGKVSRSYDIKGYEPRRAGPQDGYRSYGRVIEIAHSGFNTLYAHLSSRMAKVGDQVKEGQQIGLSGNTGNTTGAHLHFGSQGIDPRDFWKSGFGRVIAAARGAISGVAGDVVQSIESLLNPAESLWGKVKSTISSGVGDSPFGQAIGKFPSMIYNGVVKWAKDHISGGGDEAAPGGSGVERWRGTVVKALKANGLPTTDDYVNAWLRQIGTESGGNEKITQGISDINSASGNRAEGLAQVIPPTFNAYKFPGHDNIFNGYDNLLAAINYAKHAYGKGMLGSIGHGHGYAKGTTGASPGYRWAGENGPELIKFKGGEKVLDHQSSKAAIRMGVPGYDTGGVVKGFKPGANAKWVSALKSQLYMGEDQHWGAGLTKKLKKLDGIVPAFTGASAKNGKLAARRVMDIASRFPVYSTHAVQAGIGRIRNPKQRRAAVTDARKKKALSGRNAKHWRNWEWIAKQVNYDPTRLWRYWKDIEPAAAKKRGGTGKASGIFSPLRGAQKQFWVKRAGWVTALEKEMGMPSTKGKWLGNNKMGGAAGPLRHIIDHAFGWKVGTHGHKEWSPRPWKAWTPAEKALQEEERTNSLNAEWDKIMNKLGAWGYSYAVRKLQDVGTADGMDIARNLFKSKTLASRYNSAAKVELDRADAASGDTANASKDAQYQAVQNALRNAPAGMGLQALASAISLSVDTTANLVKAMDKGKKWADIPTSKRSRVVRESGQFSNLFKFATGGMIPGGGNRDSVPLLGMPGELIVRKAATNALVRDYGPGITGMLNNYDRMAKGGLVASTMTGLNMPSVGNIHSIKRDDSYQKNVTYNFNTDIHNPTLEEGGLSVQKRVTSIARLGILNRDD